MARWRGKNTLFFNLISLALLSIVCTWFYVTFTPDFRLSHLYIYNPQHYTTPPPLSTLLSTLLLSVFELSHPFPSPSFPAVAVAPKTQADRDHYCYREDREHKCPKESSHAPVRCFSLYPLFLHLPAVQPPNPDKSFDSMTRETFQTGPRL